MNDDLDHAGAIAANLDCVKSRIDKAARESGRDGGEICLLAVSKKFGPETIRAAIAAGQKHFGENRVQEGLGKWPGIRHKNDGLCLHLIGPLQTNKTAVAVGLFDVIQTLDRPKLARYLAREMDTSGLRPDCFIQINTGEEPQKAGIVPGEADAFIRDAIDNYGLPVKGLMCIPPIGEEPAPHFALLAKIAAGNGLAALSMGMSADYELAIALGATHVRVGTAIFGARPAAGVMDS